MYFISKEKREIHLEDNNFSWFCLFRMAGEFCSVGLQAMMSAVLAHVVYNHGGDLVRPTGIETVPLERSIT